jgi:hypothetical protein
MLSTKMNEIMSDHVGSHINSKNIFFFFVKRRIIARSRFIDDKTAFDRAKIGGALP